MATGEEGNSQQATIVSKWKRWSLLLVVPLLSLVAIQPILTGILPWRGDGLLHLYRLAELERAVRAGVFFPRWSPDLGYGFGFPLFNYYAPFSYYVGLIPRLLGSSLPVSMAISYILSLWGLGWGVWFWARDVWQSGLAAVTAVLAILYAPYILYNTYHRAALAELWGMAFLALTLWAIHRGVRDWRLGTGGWEKSIILVAIFYTLLILSHNITALIGTPLIIGYAMFLTINKQQGTENREQPTKSLTIYHLPFTINHYSFSLILLALLLGLGLSAFFWLPAFFERNLVQIENLTATASFSYLNHFLNLNHILALPKTAVPQQVNPNIPRALSWPILLLAILAWLPTKTGTGDWRLGARKSHRFALTLVTLLCLFMVTPLSQPIWQVIDLLSFVQFPWRFLGPTSLFLALLAGFGASQLHSQFTIHNSQFTIIYTIIITSIIILYALPWLFPSQANTLPNDISPSETAVFESETGWLGTTAAADYLPRTVQTLPTADGLTAHLNTNQFPDTLIVEELQEDYTAVSFTYTAQEPTTAVFHIFHFPGWHATLDGHPTKITPSDPYGRISIDLPAGTHTVQLNFGNTQLRTIANVISFISLIILIALIVFHASRITHHAKTNNQQSTSNSQQSTNGLTIHHLPFTINHFLPAILTVLAIFVLKTAVLDHTDTIFRTTNYALRTTHYANFNNTIQLINTDLPTAPIPADQPIDLTLTWQAIPPVDDEYSISVQLIGDNNIRYAQSDSFHPAGLPLPRWQAGEYGIDNHSLTALPATPPGDYELIVFVYNLANGQRLNILNEAGLPIGNFYSLGNLTLTSPTQFPDPVTMQIGQRETADSGTSPFLFENIQLLGFDQPAPTISVGESRPIPLYWHTPKAPQHDYVSGFWMGCENQGIIIPSYPEDSSAPDSSWQVGQIERSDLILNIPLLTAHGQPTENDTCTIYLDLAWMDDGVFQDFTFIALDTIQIIAPNRTYDVPDTAVSINQSLSKPDSLFNQTILVAIEPIPMTYQPGDSISLILYWQPHSWFGDDYKVFVQLLGQDGRILTQQDQIPANNTRPTTGWIPNEIIQDNYQLTIPADAPAGTYQLITGLYHAQTGQRLTLSDQSGDAITIPIPIEVKLAE